MILLFMRLLIAPLCALFLIIGIYFAEHTFVYWSKIAIWKDTLLFLSGFIIGIRWPDWDLLTSHLDHRSAITHSALLPLVLFLNPSLASISGGLAFGISLHLSSDIQPKAWIGNALIKLPFTGSIGKVLSPFWILMNIILCLSITLNVINQETEPQRIQIIMLTSACLFWYFTTEEKRRLVPLGTFILSSWFVYSVYIETLTWKTITQLFK